MNNPDVTKVLPTPATSAQRSGSAIWVKRYRCGECGHLKKEHVKNSFCGDFYLETILLPACIYCGRACDDVEDEMCQRCWNKSLLPNQWGKSLSPNEKLTDHSPE